MPRFGWAMLTIALAACTPASPAHGEDAAWNADLNGTFLDLAGHPIIVDLAWSHVWPDLFRLPPSVDAMPPAEVCGRDGGARDAGPECAPPASECADDRWLMYYTKGECVAGLCHWQVAFMDCVAAGADNCVHGGCHINVTG